MKAKQFLLMGVAVIAMLTTNSLVFAANGQAHTSGGTSLVQDVRSATTKFQDFSTIKAAGYTMLHGCVAGPLGGAMGVHYVNGDLVGDAKVDVTKPEVLMYEMRGGRMQLLGVEYVVFAEAWDKANKMPPVLKGQLFAYNTAPNRYGIPAYYGLHVWAWRANPSGTFADWNPRVSCDEYNGENAMISMTSHRPAY